MSFEQREADERERQRRETERREIQLKAAKEKLEQLRQTTIGAKVFNDMDEQDGYAVEAEKFEQMYERVD